MSPQDRHQAQRTPRDKTMSRKRIETQSSRTVAYNRFSRGCAMWEKDPRFRGPDYMAEVVFPL